MRTIQMTLDENLVASVDRVVKKLKTTRSAFTRKALKDAIKQVNLNMLYKSARSASQVETTGDYEAGCPSSETRDGFWIRI